METVFFYGLFMDQEFLEAKGFSPRNLRYARLHDYELRIGERATLSPKLGACSYGTVMDMPAEELNTLYGSEGVEDYVAERVEVDTGEAEFLQALVYILPEEKVAGSNSEYAARLAEVAGKLGLADEYVEEIKRWI